MVQVLLGRWGHNVALRIPGGFLQSGTWREGRRVEVEAHDDMLVIRPVDAPIDLRAAFAGEESHVWRAAYGSAFEWGADIGREAIQE